MRARMVSAEAFILFADTEEMDFNGLCVPEKSGYAFQ